MAISVMLGGPGGRGGQLNIKFAVGHSWRVYTIRPNRDGQINKNWMAEPDGRK